MTGNDQRAGAGNSARAYGISAPDFRLPDATVPGAVRLQVTDLDRSVDYYERVIGAAVISRTDEAVGLGAHGGGRPLVWLHERRDGRPVPRTGTLGLYHFALLLPDRPALGRFLGHLSRAGIRAGSADHLVSEALYLGDPDGLGIEVYADRPRHTWRHEDRQLLMATEPLDVRGLVAAAGGGTWEGLPPGSTVGHVHLHVGNLREAEAYYHAALGLDKTVWSYPGALFLSAGGYHHHLATNTWVTGPPAAADQARLLEWELLVPGADHAAAAARRVEAAGYAVRQKGDGWITPDPWGTPLHIRASEAQ